MHRNHVQENRVCSYTLISKHRGVFIWSMLILFIFLFKYFFVSGSVFRPTLMEILVVWSPIIVLTAIHVLWDFLILKNHWDVKISNRKLVFCRKNTSFEVHMSDVSKVERFPTSEDIYDQDYVDNMMSSGIRIFTSSGDKLLVFSKIRGFSDIQEFLKKSGRY